MPSNINPTLKPTKSLDKFRFWCQKVLPLVYDDSLSYYEVLGKMVVQLNDVIDNINADTENVLTLKDAFDDLQEYVDNFFDDVEHLADYAERAEAAQTAANSSAINAASSAVNASISSQAAMDARAAAQTAAQDATASKNDAVTAATTATTKAGEAAQSAINAQTAQAGASQSATLADAARSVAQTAAATATAQANDANESATAAATSEQNVENLVEGLPSDFTELVNDVSNIKKSVNVQYAYPTLTGSINENGELQSTYFHSEIIPVKAFSQYMLKFTSTGTFTLRVHAYNSEANDEEYDVTTWIKQLFSTSIFAGNIELPFYIDDPNINYIRISARGDQIENSRVTISYIKELDIGISNKKDMLSSLILNARFNNLMDLASNVGAANHRFIQLDHNSINQFTVREDAGGSTFYSYLISNNPRYLGGNITTTINNLEPNDFTDFDIYSNQSIVVNIETYTKNHNPNIGSEGPQIYIATYNPNTGEKKYYLAFSVTGTTDGLIAGTTTNLFDSLPEIRENKNIAIIYTSRRPSVECKTVIEFNTTREPITILKEISSDVENSGKATKAYSINDFLMMNNTLYLVTANISSGEDIIVGTNVSATTVGEQLTALLNS